MSDERVPDSRDPNQLVLPLDVPASYFAPVHMPVPIVELLAHLIQPHRHSQLC